MKNLKLPIEYGLWKAYEMYISRYRTWVTVVFYPSALLAFFLSDEHGIVAVICIIAAIDLTLNISHRLWKTYKDID